MDNKIQKWRGEIDAIDDELLVLLNRRARLATEIGQVKKREHSPLVDPDRERIVLARICQSNEGPLKEEGIRTIFKTIIDESRRIQSIESASETVSVTTAPKWNRVTIIGCGLIGASFALALKQSGMCRRIAGWDVADHVNRDALGRGIIDEVDTSFSGGAVSPSDLVYLAMPVAGIVDFLRERGSQISKGALVTDAGSTKVDICRAAREHLPDEVVFVGGHPIAGSEHSGLDHADERLFRNAPYLLVSDEQTDQVRSFSAMLSLAGARVSFIAAEDHDRAVALVSHLAQLLSVSLAAMVAENPQAGSLLNLSGKGFRDMTRLAGSSWSMWGDILETNHAQIGKALDAFAKKLEATRRELRARSEGRGAELIETEKLFAQANRLAEASSREPNNRR